MIFEIATMFAEGEHSAMAVFQVIAASPAAAGECGNLDSREHESHFEIRRRFGIINNLCLWFNPDDADFIFFRN